MSTEVPGSDPTEPKLGDIVTARRMELGWTQQQVSERMNMSQEWVTKVERGRIKRPRVPSLIALADVLDMNADALIIAAGYARSSSGAQEIVAQARAEQEREAELLPPHLRASFFKVRELSPERQERVAQMIDLYYEEDQLMREQMKRDLEAREAEGLES